MLSKVQVICSVFLLIGCCSAVKKVPEYIHICNRNDPNVAKCIRSSVEVLRPKLKDGIPEFGVPGVDPFIIDEIVIYPGGEGQNLKAILRDVHVSGTSNYQILKLKIDVPKQIYRFNLRMPAIRLQGVYDIDAKVLVAPIKGTGKFDANVTDVEARCLLTAEVKTKESHKFLSFNSLNIQLQAKDYEMYLDNLFNGDNVLSKAANEVLNSNKDEFIRIAIPFVQRKASEILLNIANKITQDIDYDEVFPEK